WHHYFEVYQKFLGRFRGTAPTVLEIGVQRGGSLRMWRKFFGAGARIIGVDVDPACAAVAQDGFEIHIRDQADVAFLRRLIKTYEGFDIVIDDGGHKTHQQITTFEQLYGSCREVFIVEDTHTNYWPAFQDRADGQTFISYSRKLIDSLHEWHFQPRHFAHYGKSPATRGPDANVSEFCRTTKAITFADSMVIFEKGINPPRHHERR